MGLSSPWHEPVLAKTVRTVYLRNAVLFQYNRLEAGRPPTQTSFSPLRTVCLVLSGGPTLVQSPSRSFETARPVGRAKVRKVKTGYETVLKSTNQADPPTTPTVVVTKVVESLEVVTPRVVAGGFRSRSRSRWCLVGVPLWGRAVIIKWSTKAIRVQIHLSTPPTPASGSFMRGLVSLTEKILFFGGLVQTRFYGRF